MKIYVFTYHAACSCEYLGTVNKVFRTLGEALKAFKEWKDDELNYIIRDNWKITSNSPLHLEAFEDGDYCANHTEGYINEYEI